MPASTCSGSTQSTASPSNSTFTTPQAIIVPGRFLASDAYRPLPSLIESARSLFERGDLPRIHRAAAATEPAIRRISEIIHEAARDADDGA